MPQFVNVKYSQIPMQQPAVQYSAPSPVPVVVHQPMISVVPAKKVRAKKTGCCAKCCCCHLGCCAGVLFIIILKVLIVFLVWGHLSEKVGNCVYPKFYEEDTFNFDGIDSISLSFTRIAGNVSFVTTGAEDGSIVLKIGKRSKTSEDFINFSHIVQSSDGKLTGVFTHEESPCLSKCSRFEVTVFVPETTTLKSVYINNNIGMVALADISAENVEIVNEIGFIGVEGVNTKKLSTQMTSIGVTVLADVDGETSSSATIGKVMVINPKSSANIAVRVGKAVFDVDPDFKGDFQLQTEIGRSNYVYEADKVATQPSTGTFVAGKLNGGSEIVLTATVRNGHAQLVDPTLFNKRDFDNGDDEGEDSEESDRENDEPVPM